MKRRYEEDKTSSVFTARDNVESEYEGLKCPVLPKTALLFFTKKGIDYFRERYHCELILDKFPRFLQGGPVYSYNKDICFLDGGRTAPQAADTIETLKAIGVENIISAGLFGSFVEDIEIGDIVIAKKALVEEGTSPHYYSSIEYAEPDANLTEKALKLIKPRAEILVSTDAIYRQTFYKEALWRAKGAVGVDMETSAIFSVSKYLGMRSLALLMASDKHPLQEGGKKWNWAVTDELRTEFFEKIKILLDGLFSA